MEFCQSEKVGTLNLSSDNSRLVRPCPGYNSVSTVSCYNQNLKSMEGMTSSENYLPLKFHSSSNFAPGHELSLKLI